MKTINKCSKLFPLFLSVIILCAVCFWNPRNTGADTTDASITITGGLLTWTSIQTNFSFTGITLDGTEQTASKDLTPLLVTDARGTGAGWSIEVSATQFKTGDLSQSLDWGSLTIVKPTTISSDFPGDAPTSSLTSDPYTLDNENLSTVPLVNAATDAGLGLWTISWDPGPLKVIINPATTRAGVYTSTITWQLNATP